MKKVLVENMTIICNIQMMWSAMGITHDYRNFDDMCELNNEELLLKQERTLKTYNEYVKSQYPYATIFQPTENGIAHCCKHLTATHAIYGAQDVSEFLKENDMPVYDITYCKKIIGLKRNEIVKFGGEILKEK